MPYKTQKVIRQNPTLLRKAEARNQQQLPMVFLSQPNLLNLPWVFLSIFVWSIFIVERVDGVGEVAVNRSQSEFDYFVLSLMWPGTSCQQARHCCSSNGCCRRSGPPTEFTIHGLWANYNDGTWPACCTESNFDEREISTLRGTLEKYWPSLSCSSPTNCHGQNGSFWAHEWEKHGTCSSPVVSDEYNYFLTTLNVYFKYNVTKVLINAGYVPSNTEKYPLGGIVSAIQHAFHTTPLLVCSGDAVDELRLCFYKDFKPRDCVAGSKAKIVMVTSEESCPRYVSLPVPQPRAYSSRVEGGGSFTLISS